MVRIQDAVIVPQRRIEVRSELPRNANWAGDALIHVRRRCTNCLRESARRRRRFHLLPQPERERTELSVPDLFHFSAQLNAPKGLSIKRYTVLLDRRPI